MGGRGVRVKEEREGEGVRWSAVIEWREGWVEIGAESSEWYAHERMA